MMDRVFGLYLTEIAPLIMSATASSAPAGAPNALGRRAQLASAGSRQSKGDQSVAPLDSSPLGEALLEAITGQANLTAIMVAAQSYYASNATAMDQQLAILGGVGTYLSMVSNGSLGQLGLALGPVVGLASMAVDIDVEVTDLHTLYSATDAATQSAAYDELQSTNGKLLLDTLGTELNSIS
jgi:hypothetical protein